MTITLYNYTGDPSKIDKDLTGATKVVLSSCTLRAPSDVVTPEILLATDPTGYNYASIDAFGRYYWITDSQAVRNGLYSVRLKSDPLKSFASQVLALPAFCVRTENYLQHEPFINDVNAQYNACDWVMTYAPYEFTEGAFKILVTAG